VSLDTLMAALARDADAEAERVLSAARAEAEAIAGRSRAELNERRRAAGAARDAARHALVEERLLGARRDANATLLEARRSLVDRVLHTARAALPSMLAGDVYRSGVPATFAAAKNCLGRRAATAHAHPAVVPLIADLATGGLPVQSDPGTGAGFRLVADDGSLEIDCTLEGRLAARTPELSIAILRRLEHRP
jgi:vacuolar-type H+-ATPase subunit E/Vma4